jgi:hypothetical protein
VLWFDLDSAIWEITALTLFVQGTKGTLVPIELTWSSGWLPRAEARWVGS